VESLFGPFGNSVSSDAIYVHHAWFALNVPLAQKSFWTHPTILLGDVAQGQAGWSPFGDSANLDAR
jgi:hypothetical protein